jgi:hypothetical protein
MHDPGRHYAAIFERLCEAGAAGHDLPFATDLSAAVARLVQLVPPTRRDLVDEVIVRVARRDLSVTLDWPPTHVAHQLVFRVRRVHAGEVPLRGRRARWST